MTPAPVPEPTPPVLPAPVVDGIRAVTPFIVGFIVGLITKYVGHVSLQEVGYLTAGVGVVLTFVARLLEQRFPWLAKLVLAIPNVPLYPMSKRQQERLAAANLAAAREHELTALRTQVQEMRAELDSRQPLQQA